MATPTRLPILNFQCASIATAIAQASITQTSAEKKCGSTFMGLMTVAIPMIDPILKIFEPTTLPIAKDEFPGL